MGEGCRPLMLMQTDRRENDMKSANFERRSDLTIPNNRTKHKVNMFDVWAGKILNNYVNVNVHVT